MIEFRDALTDLLEEFGIDDGGFKGDLPEGRYMRVDNKHFYFDIGQNNRGIYMRISEVISNGTMFVQDEKKLLDINFFDKSDSRRTSSILQEIVHLYTDSSI